MGYWSEIGAAWRPLAAATLGLATGNSIVGVVTSAIAPALIADAGWSKAEYAMIGSLTIFTAFVLPAIGRLADWLGVRLTALIGLVTLPLVYLGYSFSGGSLPVYIAIYVVQTTVCVTTASMIYTRLVVQHVEKARGLALAIVASSPAFAGMIGGPVLNAYVEANGWQASYRALALFVACTGVVTFLLMPDDRPGRQTSAATPASAAPRGYRAILSIPAFWIIAGAMLLCNLPQTLLLTQLKLLVMDQGISGADAAAMFTAMSLGMLAGRVVTGIALDRFAAHVVSFVALGVPGLGLFILASSWDAPAVVLVAVFFLGFAFGAEGDAVAYLVSRYFPLEVYGSVMGLMTAVISVSTASGAAILSITLARTGGFEAFLNGTGIAVVAGAALLLRLGRCPQAVRSHAPISGPCEDACTPGRSNATAGRAVEHGLQ